MQERVAIGQHLVTGLEGTQVSDEFARAVREYRIGNYILFGRNVESAAQLRALCGELQALALEATGHPAFIAMDQEGGAVSYLTRECAVMPGAMALAATGDPGSAYLAGLVTGQELLALGVNFNLAPVCDVNSNPDNPVIGTRSFGDRAEQAGRFAGEMARGLSKAGVLCCAKHFPGHGDTDVDSHVGLPLVDKDLAQLEALELLPFRTVIGGGVPAVMSTHILFPRIEPRRVPATLSRTLMTGLLRDRLGFGGLVLSDCMMMAAISEHYGTVPGAAEAVDAGVDLVFISHSARLAGEACELIRRRLQEGSLDGTRFAASTGRILAGKKGLRAPDPAAFDALGNPERREQARLLHRRALTAVQLPLGGLPATGGNPLFVDVPPPRRGRRDEADLSFAREMRRRFGGEALNLPDKPGPEETERVRKQAAGRSCLVLGTYNGQRRPEQMAVRRALAESGLPLICVALGSPYELADLPPGAAGIAAYAYDAPTLEALGRLLAGETDAPGRLPVRLKER